MLFQLKNSLLKLSFELRDVATPLICTDMFQSQTLEKLSPQHVIQTVCSNASGAKLFNSFFSDPLQMKPKYYKYWKKTLPCDTCDVTTEQHSWAFTHPY